MNFTIDVQQFRDRILLPVLKTMGDKYASPAAINLMLGTGAQESGFKYVVQLGSGPGLGLFQMEVRRPTDTQDRTLADLYNNYLRYHPNKLEMLEDHRPVGHSRREALTWNLAYMIVAARLQYWRISEPLPAADDEDGLARYWKTYWNTEAGDGTTDQFKKNWQSLVQA